MEQEEAAGLKDVAMQNNMVWTGCLIAKEIQETAGWDCGEIAHENWQEVGIEWEPEDMGDVDWQTKSFSYLFFSSIKLRLK